MTDGSTPGAAPAPRSAGRGKPAMWPTVLASVACFLVVFEFLAFRLTSGHDPALGASQAAKAPGETAVLTAPATTPAPAPPVPASTAPVTTSAS